MDSDEQAEDAGKEAALEPENTVVDAAMKEQAGAPVREAVTTTPTEPKRKAEPRPKPKPNEVIKERGKEEVKQETKEEAEPAAKAWEPKTLAQLMKVDLRRRRRPRY
jgi:hypothetical protein